jgi:hypothetical protein
MKLEIFTLCDSAIDYAGKLCILGAFDSVQGKTTPVVVQHCAIAGRLRFHRIEEGKHKLTVTVADQDGKIILPKIEAELGVSIGETAQSAAVNLVMAVNRLKLEEFGEYTVDLGIDGVHLGSLPLYCSPIPTPA